jgi:hypothetical protein
MGDYMSTRAEIKYLLFKENSSITKIAMEMTQKTGNIYTMRSLSQKLLRGTLRADEYKLIVDILGYDVKLIKRK